MKVENVEVYNLDGAIKASKYPMATNINKCTAEEYCNKITELYNQFDKVERKICNYIQN